MVCTKDIRCANHSLEGFVFTRDSLAETKKLSISLKDKIVSSASATFEGIGLAGIVSAALWYTTAPTAPDGFKGPISTFSIAFAAIVSLIVALPIAFAAYKKLICELEKFYDELYIEYQNLDQNNEEIFYELLKLRSMFNTDQEFKSAIKTLAENAEEVIDHSATQSICNIYTLLKNKRFAIVWQTSKTLTAHMQESNDSNEGKLFAHLVKESHLSNNQIFRKAITQYIYKIIPAKNIFSKTNIHTSFTTLSKPKNFTTQKENILYGLVAGITCSEVLLSIGWTLFSILIGLEILQPISDFNWWIYAISCILIGISFGFGIGLNKQQQKYNNWLKDKVKQLNFIYSKVNESLKNLFTKKILEQEKSQGRLKPKMTLVRKLKSR